MRRWEPPPLYVPEWILWAVLVDDVNAIGDTDGDSVTILGVPCEAIWSPFVGRRAWYPPSDWMRRAVAAWHRRSWYRALRKARQP